MSALLILNVQLALVSVIVVPFLALTSVLFFRAVSKRYEKFQEQDAKLSTTLQENLSGVRVVKAFARQDYEIDKFETENKQRYRLGLKLLMMHAFFWPLSDMMAGAQMLGGYVLGALMVIDGTITLGTYLAYVGMSIWIIEPMRGLGRIIVQASTGLVSYERVAEIIREEREPLTEGLRDLPEPLARRSRLRRRGLRLQQGRRSAAPHQLPSRAGAVGCAAGIDRVGQNVAGQPAAALLRVYERQDHARRHRTSRRFHATICARKIGIVEQEPFLFSRTIRENITYGVSARSERRGS